MHIPYCLQKCVYCDFVKFEVSELPPIDSYIKLLCKELKLNSHLSSKKVKSLYFGGGTPSLLSTKQFATLINETQKYFTFVDKPEINIEINPGTLSLSKVQELKTLGVTRYSLGVQTFKTELLQSCGRKHSAEDSLNDLQILKSQNINFSVDILFGIPNQGLHDLESDLDTLIKFKPPHVSPYNLTLPKQHFFNQNRPSDQIQTTMMELISEKLSLIDVFRYEVSNYAKAGYESVHNKLYWSDAEYLGFGMGAHSYLHKEVEFLSAKPSPWGTRFWNPNSYQQYEESLTQSRPKIGYENLKLHESLTDFCHTHLRQLTGLSRAQLMSKYGEHNLPPSLFKNLTTLEQKGLITYKNSAWTLSSTGLEIPNEVFRYICFLEEDMNE